MAYAIGTVVACVILIGIVASLKARRLDALHKNIVKSRVALEAALNSRARCAIEVSRSGVLNLASSVVVDQAASECLQGAGYVLVDDGLEDIYVSDPDGERISALKRGGPNRVAAESELSRVLRYTVDELDDADIHGDVQLLAELDRVRQAVRLTRRFHNIHVAGARRIRRTLLARMFRIHGYASWPQTVDLDDE